MNSGLKRSHSPENGAEYVVQRKKLKHSTIDFVKKLLNSGKGEAIQALHMVFTSNSFNFEIIQHSNSTSKFACFLNIEGYSFIGYGDKKISAKSSASRTALNYLIQDLKSDDDCGFQDFLIVNPYDFNGYNVTFADVLAGLVLQKYNELKNEFKNDLPWYKMIAGIVMVIGDDYSHGKVVALSTGSKCIDKQYIAQNGCVIIDAHAEILCRRAFLRFLYNNIEEFTKEEDSVFEHVPGNDKLKLREYISFHLFVNSAPCGDCRIFAVSTGDVIDRHPNRISRGILRVKLDGGSSTVPINNYRKYEAENRIMVMSCSDKLLKMNCLGVQGSLLSHIIDPVYLTGIVISDLFQNSHVARALYGRIEGNDDLLSPFDLHKISINRTSTEFKIAAKSPKTSINWIINESVEILNSVNGKTLSKEVSRLSKRRLFEKFYHVYCQFKKSKNDEILDHFYGSFKEKSQSYQIAKSAFIRVLEHKNLGKWINRELSLDKFKIFDSVTS